MRKLILKMSMTVDGFVCGPQNEVEWVFGSMDEGANAWTMDLLWSAGLHIMGSRTYYDMASYWPYSEEIYAAPMNEIPKLIFSRAGLIEPPRARLAVRQSDGQASPGEAAGLDSGRDLNPVEAEWAEPRVSADLAGEIARLKAEDGKPILAHGGAGFARSLIATGLVDELRLLVHPVLLGRGKSIFSDLPQPLDLKLASCSTFAGGAIAQIYRPAQNL